MVVSEKPRIEIFKNVNGYQGLYKVGNMGSVISLPKKHVVCNGSHYITRQKSMKLSLNNYGYKVVTLHKNKRQKLFLVHRLVAMAFIPNPQNKPFVNHKNLVKTDNTVENLEWCTPKENSIHAYENGVIKSFNTVGVENGRSKLNELQVRIIRRIGYQMSAKKIAEYFDISTTMASNIRRNLNWKHI